MATTEKIIHVQDNLKAQPKNIHQGLKSEAIPKKLSFDPVELKQKYLEQRNKRLRDDGGVEQYRPIEGSLSHYIQDPYIRKEINRGPIDEECTVLIVGGGYGGQLVAVKLLQVGIKDIRIVEKGGNFGGTWYVGSEQLLRYY